MIASNQTHAPTRRFSRARLLVLVGVCVLVIGVVAIICVAYNLFMNGMRDTVSLPDGTTLRIVTKESSSTEKAGTGTAVGVDLYSNRETLVWYDPDVTSVVSPSLSACYYALVKVMEDRIFIFFTWNSQHCTIDRQTGRILEKGEGDDVLRRYGGLVRLRLTVFRHPVSIGLPLQTGREAERRFPKKR